MTTVARAINAINALRDSSLVIGFDPDAVARAMSEDVTHRGVLAGQAIVVKDNIAVPGHPTGGGSPVLAGHHEPVGTGVKRLLRAGAVVVATVNMHELAFGVSGRNDWWGMPRNPAAPDRLPGGSSSGSAVAVASGVVNIALATDTGGSARIPAACCGVVGFRPGAGRYPSDGILTLSPTRDTIGVIARSVADLLPVDAILAGEIDANMGPGSAVTHIAVLDDGGLALCDASVAEAYSTWVQARRVEGVRITEVDVAPLLALDDQASFPIALRETILEFRRRAADMNMAYDDFVAGIAGDDVRALMASDPPSEHARRQAIDRVLPQMVAWYGQTLEAADMLALPTIPALPPLRDEHETMMVQGEAVPTFQTLITFTSPASLAGVPSLSLPIPCEGGPAAIMLEAPRGADRHLMAMASTIETSVP